MSKVAHIGTLRELDSSVSSILACFPLQRHIVSVHSHPTFYWASPETITHELPSRGYKLHVSVGLDHVVPALSRLLPVLFELEINFKCITSGTMAAALNSGALGLTQVGKIMTIYPTTLEEFYRLVERIRPRTIDLVGPRVPSDLPVPDSESLYYRYGEFSETASPDSRLPGDSIPPGVLDPYPSSAPVTGDEVHSLRPIADRFIFFDVLRQRGKGGVYKAFDLMQRASGPTSRPRPVVVKEGRRYGERGLDGRDARDRLRQQEQVLLDLENSSPHFVKCIDFTEGETSSFLILEYSPLLNSLRSRLIAGERPGTTQLEHILRLTEEAVLHLHTSGYAWCDLSADNILVDDEWSFIAIADVEDAVAVACMDSPLNMTPGFGYVGPTPVEAWVRDIHALKCLRQYCTDLEKFASFLQTGSFPSISLPATPELETRT